MVYYSSKTLDYTTIKNQQAYHAVAGTDHETSKKYKLQHTNAFVSYNRENECLFGCKLSRTTWSVREDKLCPPSLSKSSFARSNSFVGTQKRFLGPEPHTIGLLYCGMQNMTPKTSTEVQSA